MSTRLRRGFTLIELLVVLVIISIIISMATLSLGNNEARQVQDTADTLSALMELAKEEALFNGQDMGVAFWQDGYAFYRLQDQQPLENERPLENQQQLETQQQWTPIVDDNEFRPRDLPAGISIALYLDGLDVDLPADAERRKRPQVFIMSSGEITPFKAQIGVGDTQLILTADALGNLAYARPPS